MSANIDAVAYNSIYLKYFLNGLQVESDGSTWYLCQYSQQGMNIRELGVYHTTFPQGDAGVNAIFDMIQERKLFEMQEKSLPGQVAPPKTIFINKHDITKAFNSDPDGSYDAPFLELEQALERLTIRLNQYPIFALSLNLSISRNQCAPGKELEMQLKFSNRGMDKVSFVNPRYVGDNVMGNLTVELWESVSDEDGKPDANLVLSIDCSKIEYVIGYKKVVPSDQMILELKPGGSLLTVLRLSFPKCDPGTYLARAIYESNADEETKIKNLVRGFYCTDLVPLEVLRR
jgi:hypothetical protein